MYKNIYPLVVLCTLLSACSSEPVTVAPDFTPPPGIKIATPTSCTTLTVKPTPGPESPSLFPPVRESDQARGAVDSSVTFTAYIDYQDPRSKSFVDVSNRILTDYADVMKIVFRLFPLLGVNDKSALSMQAVEAADAQGKFWEMHDLLFAQHENWISLSAADFEQWVTAQSTTVDLNVEQFKSDFKSEAIIAKVKKYAEDGKAIGIPGTPLILINGQIYGGPRDYGSFRDIIELILLGKRQFTTCPPLTVQTNHQYTATLHTENGDVVIELFADKAPITVNSFIFLARNGWYDDITFHRVIPNLFALTGDPSGTGNGNPGYYIINEFDASLKFNRPGMVGMTNSGPNASNGQFFVTFAPTAQFDGQYTIFGQVVSGMDVLSLLSPRDAQPGGNSRPGDLLFSVTVEEK